VGDGDVVNRDETASRLPPVYQRVMSWLADGVPPDEIAARLGIERSAIPSLIELAKAKFARAVEEASQEREP
jgi:DNA-directed RNA polymerase specialized sigma24 family protein